MSTVKQFKIINFESIIIIDNKFNSYLFNLI